MYTVRIWDIAKTVDHVVTRDYFDIYGAIVSAGIDLGVNVPDPAEWFRSSWQEISDGVSIFYNGNLAVSIVDRSIAPD